MSDAGETTPRRYSTERLDGLLAVASPAAWMALAAMGAVVFSILLWGMYGVVAEMVDGGGMLVDAGGMAKVVHHAGGRVEELLVAPGSQVRQGDVIARLADPAADNDILLKRESIQLASDYSQSQTGRFDWNAAISRRDAGREVLATASGIVAETPVAEGDMTTAGATVFATIRREAARGDLRAVVYVPLENGKRVKPGMTVQLTPAEVDVKDTGFLLGRVLSVSLYPVSADTATQTVGSRETAEFLLKKAGGAALEVRIHLIERQGENAGFLWTARSGSSDPLTPGGYASARILVKKETPIRRFFLRLSEIMREL